MSQAFVAPDWLLRWETTDELLLLDLSTAENFLIEGKLASALISGSHFPLIEGLSLVQPSLSRFVSDWKANGVQSFTRRALLQGSGWSTCFLELTARCNERCLHCYAESSPSRTEELPIQKVLEVIKSAGILGFQRLQLTGGDPLIASSCAQAAEFAASIGLPVIEVYTNGLALHGTLFERLRDIKASFAFSVYSPCFLVVIL